MSSARGARFRSVVCDDDANTLEVVGAMLRAHGFRSIGVQTGQEAVERAAAEHPAAIVLDLAMPGMDGWETLAALKARTHTREIPVLILSGVERTGMEPIESSQVWMTKHARAHTRPTTWSTARTGVRGRSRTGGHPHAGLVASGVETQHATNSERAIALTSKGNPDVLLLNVPLAADSGLQVVDGLRERDQLRRVPVVIYSRRDMSTPEAVQERVMTLLKHFHVAKAVYTPHKHDLGPAEVSTAIAGRNIPPTVDPLIRSHQSFMRPDC